MKSLWGASTFLAALAFGCGGKISAEIGSDAGATTDAGATHVDGGCEPVAPARDCMRAGGVCGGNGTNVQCARGFKPSPTHSCTSTCGGGGTPVSCCVPDFGPPIDASTGCNGTCCPADVSAFVPPPYHPASHEQGRCSTAQIGSFFDDCLAPNATMQSCAPWGSSGPQTNRDCVACLVTTDTAPRYGVLVEHRGNVSLNVAGCMEIEDGANGLACAKAYQASEDCGNAACEAACPVTDEASFQLYQACVQRASQVGCARYAQAAACANAEADGGAAVCFRGQTFRDLYLALAGVFCGP